MKNMKHIIRFYIIVIGFLPFITQAQIAPDVIVNMNIADLRKALDTGKVRSVDIVSAYISEIKKNNKHGKKLNAVISLNSDALAQARAWDKQFAERPGMSKSILAGIPFLVKDNIDTKGIVTSAGSVALKTSKPAQDAFIVKKLLNNGAILLGKTNMSELAASYGWLGYSSYGGQTVNPYNPLRDASGSSSGSAVAVAANFAPFALGTDTSGSIRGPSSVTGTVGMRPTLGLTSRSGIVPLSLTADNAGVITRTVEDQTIVLEVIRGEDASDAATKVHPQQSTSLTASLEKNALRGKTIAVVDNFYGGNPDVDEIGRAAENVLKQAGANVVHISLPKIYENLWSEVLGPVGVAEFRAQFNVYLSSLPDGQPKDMTQFMTRLDKLTDNGKKLINPGRYKGLQESYANHSLGSAAYISILTNTIPNLRAQLTGIMDSGHFDALFFPTMSCPATVIHGKQDSSYVCQATDEYAASYIASSTGFPEITVNAGQAAGGVPVGISFFGRANDDAKLLGLAYSFEANR